MRSRALAGEMPPIRLTMVRPVRALGNPASASTLSTDPRRRCCNSSTARIARASSSHRRGLGARHSSLQRRSRLRTDSPIAAAQWLARHPTGPSKSSSTTASNAGAIGCPRSASRGPICPRVERLASRAARTSVASSGSPPVVANTAPAPRRRSPSNSATLSSSPTRTSTMRSADGAARAIRSTLSGLRSPVTMTVPRGDRRSDSGGDTAPSRS